MGPQDVPNEPNEAAADSTADFLGISVHPKTMAELTELVGQGIREHRKWIVANHNLHSLYLFHRQPRLRSFFAAAHWTHIDGMPIVALGRLYGYDLQRDQRVTYADWTKPLVEAAAARGWRMFYLGSPKGVAEKGAAVLRSLYAGLHMEVSDGYFDARPGSAENEAIVARINAYKPDLLMVGMGMPRQEYWIHDNFEALDTRVILPSGAAIDYIAGAVPTPPRWAGRMGLEWLYRLLHEPRRLFGRYCVEPWYILMLIAMDFVRNGGKLKRTPKNWPKTDPRGD